MFLKNFPEVLQKHSTFYIILKHGKTYFLFFYYNIWLLKSASLCTSSNMYCGNKKKRWRFSFPVNQWDHLLPNQSFTSVLNFLCISCFFSEASGFMSDKFFLLDNLLVWNQNNKSAACLLSCWSDTVYGYGFIHQEYIF